MALIEVMTFKRAFVEEIPRLWLNSYTYDSIAGVNTSEGRQNLHNIILAEQHRHLGHVEICGAVAFDELLLNPTGLDFRAFSFSHTVHGGYAPESGAPALGWDFGLILAKNSPTGRAGRTLLRQCLVETDVVEYPGGIHGLIDERGLENIETRYYDAFMRDVSWMPVNVKRDELTFTATDPRPVLSWHHHGVTKLTSQADAELRKTYVAQPFQRDYQAGFFWIHLMNSEWQLMIDSHNEVVPLEVLSGVMVTVQSAGAVFVAASKYWEDGVKPGVAPYWRPSAGLDANSGFCLQKVLDAVEIAKEFIKQVNELIAQSGPLIPKTDLEELSPNVWRLVAIYALVLRLERWTGVPIPHPGFAPPLPGIGG